MKLLPLIFLASCTHDFKGAHNAVAYLDSGWHAHRTVIHFAGDAPGVYRDRDGRVWRDVGEGRFAAEK
jgi:hypothetical protein